MPGRQRPDEPGGEGPLQSALPCRQARRSSRAFAETQQLARVSAFGQIKQNRRANRADGPGSAFREYLPETDEMRLDCGFALDRGHVRHVRRRPQQVRTARLDRQQRMNVPAGNLIRDAG